MNPEVELEPCSFEDATHFKVGERVFGPGEWRRAYVGVKFQIGIDEWTGELAKYHFPVFNITPMRVKTVEPLVCETESFSDRNGGLIARIPMLFGKGKLYVCKQKPLTFEVEE